MRAGRANLRAGRANLRAGRVNLRPTGGGRKDGRTDRRTDRQTDVWKFTPVSYRTLVLWGRCPKRLIKVFGQQ